MPKGRLSSRASPLLWIVFSSISPLTMRRSKLGPRSTLVSPTRSLWRMRIFRHIQGQSRISKSSISISKTWEEQLETLLSSKIIWAVLPTRKLQMMFLATEPSLKAEGHLVSTTLSPWWTDWRKEASWTGHMEMSTGLEIGIPRLPQIKSRGL